VRRLTLPRPAVFLFGAAVLLTLASLADPWAYQHLWVQGVDGHDWGRALRVMGWVPLWWALAAGMALQSPRDRRPALLLAGAPTLAGILGEALKLVIRRERPAANAGAYVFRSFADRPFSSTGLGMPSSHVVVALAAAAILARLWPRTRWIGYGLAIGCALTRVFARAHFLSDVVAGAIVGYAVAALLWQRFAPAKSAPHPSAAHPI